MLPEPLRTAVPARQIPDVHIAETRLHVPSYVQDQKYESLSLKIKKKKEILSFKIQTSFRSSSMSFP